MTVPEVQVGDLFVWCGHAVRVEAVRFTGHPFHLQRQSAKPGRYFDVLVDDGNRRTLHYFDSESVGEEKTE